MKKTFTTFSIGKLLDVFPTTVANWIDNGKLKAYTTVGGHRRVNSGDLLKFLNKYNMPIHPDLIPLPSMGRKKILIVDDDSKILKSFKRILESQKRKYKVFIAVDGFEAGQALTDVNPDLVILDLRLPGLDGYKVCQMIKKRNDSIKIIAISGFHDSKSILSKGADFFLPKPVDTELLLEKIHSLLS